MNRTSIYVFESQPIVVRGIEALVADSADLTLAGSASAPSEALDSLRNQPADVVLVDANIGLRTALRFISDLAQVAQAVQPVLWAQSLTDVDASRVLQLGARGVARKSLPLGRLLECVRTVAAGGIWLETDENEPDSVEARRARSIAKLTPRERQVAISVCRGMRNREIADQLSITPGTVKVHLMHIFEKTGMKDRFELAIHGRRLLGVESHSPVATDGSSSADSGPSDSSSSDMELQTPSA